MDLSSRISNTPGCPPCRRDVLKAGLLAFSAMGFHKTGQADESQGVQLSSESLLSFGRLERAVKDLDGFLRAIDFQRNAFIGVNYFGVSVGGIDAIKDLEEGRGVDPETFSALQAGFASPAVARNLNLKKNVTQAGRIKLQIESADGRLRYKGSAVRLYSRQKLREMFDRREAFRAEDDRKRTSELAEYVSKRLQNVGKVEGSSQSEVRELSERYRKLRPIIGDVESALQTEVTTSTILPGNEPHLFGLAIGGIDVVRDLNELGTVDPESFAAILADKLSTDQATRFSFESDGRILYNEKEVRLYSQEQLVKSFKKRELLSQMAKSP